MVLGPSGSGKTTLLSMVAGFVNVSGGAIYLDEQRLDTFSPEKRNVGMVVQNYALFPHMSVYRNVSFPLRMRRMGRSDIDAMVHRAWISSSSRIRSTSIRASCREDSNSG